MSNKTESRIIEYLLHTIEEIDDELGNLESSDEINKIRDKIRENVRNLDSFLPNR